MVFSCCECACVQRSECLTVVEELIMKSLKEYGIMDVQLLRLHRSGPTTTSLSEYCPTRLPAVLVGEY